MGIHQYECWPKSLDIVTTVCESLSVVALVLTLVIHGVYQIFRGEARGSSERGAVILQISFWLATSHLLILLFMNKNLLGLSDEGCVAVGIILHFTLLTSFGWMLVEGFLLYRMVVVVFDKNLHVKNYNMLIGYVMPTVIVTATAGVAAGTGDISNGYGNAAQCWLNSYNGYIWAFNAPIILIVLTNFAVVCKALRIAYKSSKSKEESSTFTRRWVKGCLALVTMMGITWVFGTLTFIPAIWPLYIFGILNGLQGVFIFLFQCVLNERLMSEIQKVIARIKKSQVDSFYTTTDTNSKPKKGITNENENSQMVISCIASSSSEAQSVSSVTTGRTTQSRPDKFDGVVMQFTPFRKKQYNFVVPQSSSRVRLTSIAPASEGSPEEFCRNLDFGGIRRNSDMDFGRHRSRQSYLGETTDNRY